MSDLANKINDPSSGDPAWSKDTIGLLDALPVAIIILSENGRVRWVNAAAASLIGDFPKGMMWRELVRDIIREQPGGGLGLANGRYISVCTSPLKVQPGQLIVLNDVTENRRLQDAMSQHRRLSAMGELAARLAHQIRTPLATVMLYLSQLSKISADEVHGGIVDKCMERVRYLNNVVSDMLRLARGGANDTRTLSVSELVRAIADQVTPAVEKANAYLSVTDLASDVYICGNQTLLIGMFENLVINALQATGENAGLRLIAWAAPTGTVTVSVEDNGPGVPVAERELIFEPFFTTRPQGTGLGLAVVRSIANDHRAQITVHSTPVNGARFDVVFHAVKRHSQPTQAQVASAQLLATGDVS